MQIAVYLLRQGFVLLGNLSITLCRIQKFLLRYSCICCIFYDRV